jgi:Zn-dependent protease
MATFSPKSTRAKGKSSMKWSWKLTRLAGIDVYVHATFFILIAWIALNHWQVGGTLASVVGGVGFILMLFLCVVLHELGHALTARRYGIGTRYITLLPIGGVALLERMPRDPKQEIAVALAGPMVNVVIALSLWGWLAAANALVPAEQLSVTGGPFLERLMVVNIFLALFNMLPALPMDGGRVLRAALAMRMGHGPATRTAASIGQGLALVLGLFGLFANPFLMFIALFVWIGAETEAGSAQIQSALSGVTVGQAMLTHFHTIAPNDPLARVVELTLAGTQKDFPVVADERVMGVLTQADLLKGLRAGGEHSKVNEVMQTDVHAADIGEPLDAVLERFQTSECRLVSVTASGRLAGLVNLDNILELLQFQEILEGRPA